MKKVPIEKGKYRVVKISSKALMEFIYESFMDNQEMFLETEPTETINRFYIDLEKGCFICLSEQDDPSRYGLTPAHQGIDMEVLCRNLDDTTDTMYKDGRYKDYSAEELIELSKKFSESEE